MTFHQVWLQVGAGTAAQPASAVIDSLSYRAGAPDTVVASACKISPATVPTPTRLDHQLVLNRGDVVLDPPEPGDQPLVSPAVARSAATAGQNITQGHELLLARYAWKFPAVQEPDGSLGPTIHPVLAWVLYSYPLSTTVAGCGLWGVNVYDAQTGSVVASIGWAPGP